MTGYFEDSQSEFLNPDGERFIPGMMEQDVEIEHWHRYLFVLKYIQEKRVLDIASGEGYGSSLMAKYAKKVIGVDISIATIEHAKTSYRQTNLEFLVGSCDSIPLESGSIDVVVSFETLEHHDKHIEFLSEIRRVLSKNGILIISTPDRFIYSDLTGYKNPFHVKELLLSEFKLLITTQFKFCAFFGQRYSVGSVISNLDSQDMGVFQYSRQDEPGQLPTQGGGQFKYIIAIAAKESLHPLEAFSYLEDVSFFDRNNREILRLNKLLIELHASTRFAREECASYKSALNDQIEYSAGLSKTILALTDASKLPVMPQAQDNWREATDIFSELVGITEELNRVLSKRDTIIVKLKSEIQRMKYHQIGVQHELDRCAFQLEFLNEYVKDRDC